MNRTTAAGMLAAVVLAACGACASSASPNTPPRSDTETPGTTYYAPGHRDPVPAVSAATLAGPHLALADVLGHGVVVVNVWASWCVQCRAESRGLGQLASSLRAQHVRFVGIDEQDVKAKARAFASAAHIDYPHLLDPYGALLGKLTMLPSDGIPSTLVIDGGGRIAGRIIGAADEAGLRRLVARVAGSG